MTYFTERKRYTTTNFRSQPRNYSTYSSIFKGNMSDSEIISNVKNLFNDIKIEKIDENTRKLSYDKSMIFVIRGLNYNYDSSKNDLFIDFKSSSR